MYRLSRRFRRRFGKDREERKDKHSLDYVIVLLDGSDLSFNLHKKAKGQELLDLVFKNLDLVEKDYFGLQFMDTHQVSHWLNPLKKIKKQVRIGPPFTLHFRVRFYAAEPQDLTEELTRYHFFLQIKQDISRGKLEVPLKIGVDLTGYSLQSHLGDFDPELHEQSTDYITEFKFIPNQTKELEKEIRKKHKALLGLNPAECEVNFLKIIKNMDFYGVDIHSVVGENKMECQLGLTPRGVLFVKDKEKKVVFPWQKITKISFKKNRFLLDHQEDRRHTESYTYACLSSHDAKHLWKSAIEHHTFFRLVKPTNKPTRTASFLRIGSRYRFSGRTEHQAQRDARMSARKSNKIQRATSERFSKRPTVGFIRVGSRVWGKALNGDFYKGVVTGLGEMLHIKFDNGDTIAHDRTDTECVVFDQVPEISDLEVGSRVIAHWPSLPAKLSGKVIGIEHGKYYVEYDDGDKHHNTIDQLRILKPPLYFGPGARTRRGVRKAESMKVTSLTGRAVITTELPKRSNSNGHFKPAKELKDDQQTSSSVDGATSLPSTSEVTKINDKPSESLGASNEPIKSVKKTSVSGGLPDDRAKNIHARSASLPSNVRVPRGGANAKGSPAASPRTDKKATRNKSFAGMTKTSHANKPPLDIFSLPETDVDSGISVACDRSSSGRASKRNLRIMDLMKNSKDEDKKKTEQPKSNKMRVQLRSGKTSGKHKSASPTPARPDFRVPQNAPYAPNFLETDLDDDSGKQGNYLVDAQRSFHVFIPNERNKWNHKKRFTYLDGISASNEKLLRGKDVSPLKRRRSSLPDLRTFFNQKQEVNNLQRNENKLSSRRNRTHSLNDLAKMSSSNSKPAPLHIDNLFSATENRSESPLFSPSMEQSASSNKLLLVTDL
ncbi:hypothetical protein OS493_036429 [Desmophyllum pertusum]|uniref:FERM domain-containing protein n=1 Tax=Desmophyllum pertusum TaxID=174260 RepID=A0A9W9YUV8_9CNID|nr:hypothetical protein OS493_036429 [Desmophyllum pertusum]